ncbi:MAG: permease prefix domain 1-containing protein [Planctomycetaceae bacterium]
MKVAAGLSEEEARRQAIARFGNAVDVEQECLAINRGDLQVLHGLHLVVTAGLFIGFVTLLWTTRRGPSAPLTIDSAAIQRLKHDLVEAVADGPPILTGDIEGTVFNVSGKPIANADVLVVVKSWPEDNISKILTSPARTKPGHLRLRTCTIPTGGTCRAGCRCR